jgi:hypothetical protein
MEKQMMMTVILDIVAFFGILAFFVSVGALWNMRENIADWIQCQ